MSDTTGSVEALQHQLEEITQELHAAEQQMTTAEAEFAAPVIAPAPVAPTVAPTPVVAPVVGAPVVAGTPSFFVHQTIFTPTRQFEVGEVVTAADLTADQIGTLTHIGAISNAAVPRRSNLVEVNLTADQAQRQSLLSNAQALATANANARAAQAATSVDPNAIRLQADAATPSDPAALARDTALAQVMREGK